MQIGATAGLGSGHDCTLRETDPKGVASAIHFGPGPGPASDSPHPLRSKSKSLPDTARIGSNGSNVLSIDSLRSTPIGARRSSFNCPWRSAGVQCVLRVGDDRRDRS